MIHTSPPVQIVGSFNPERATRLAERMWTEPRIGYSLQLRDKISLQVGYVLDELVEQIDLKIEEEFVPDRLAAEFYQYNLTRPATTLWHIEAERDTELGGLPIKEFPFLLGVSCALPLIVEGDVEFSNYRPLHDNEGWTRPAVDLMYEEGRKEVGIALRDPKQSARLNTAPKPGDVLLLSKGTIHAADSRRARESNCRHRMLLNGFFS